MEVENLIQQLKSDNHNKYPIPSQIIDAVRLKMRVEERNEETDCERCVRKESRAVCLTFRTVELAPHVYFCNMKIKVSPFVAAVRQCYICGKFGNIGKSCTKERQCLSSGEENHEGCCIKKCLNCNGNHRANSDRCPLTKNR
jgi:hypothetical protein